MMSSIFWDFWEIMLFSPAKSTDVSEEHMAGTYCLYFTGRRASQRRNQNAARGKQSKHSEYSKLRAENTGLYQSHVATGGQPDILS
jgi:hypothetical protein